MNDYKELEEKVTQWADERNLLCVDNALRQTLKFSSEAGELCDAMCKQRGGVRGSENIDEDVKDALGDTLVTMIILCKQLDIDLLTCLHGAYNVIAERNGRTIDGVFVKYKE